MLRIGSKPWATVTLWRRGDREPFSPADTEVLADLSEPLAQVLRERARTQPASSPGSDRPGLLIFDARGHLVSANDQAAEWLEQLPEDGLVSTHLGVRVPFWLLLTVIRARESDTGTATNRVRTWAGVWIVCHASVTHDADGSAASTAVVIEPASRATVIPVLVEAYGLTAREQEVTRLIARGLGTEAIAQALFLSPHTVRDHVKTILAKVGVASRGALVATLYAEHFEPAHLRG